jgi:hypothetical protein
MILFFFHWGKEGRERERERKRGREGGVTLKINLSPGER